MLVPDAKSLIPTMLSPTLKIKTKLSRVLDPSFSNALINLPVNQSVNMSSRTHLFNVNQELLDARRYNNTDVSKDPFVP